MKTDADAISSADAQLITEIETLRRQLAIAEQRARAGQDRYRVILDSAVDYAVIALDLHGLITEWNEGARRILGWTEPEMLGQPVTVFFVEEDCRAGIPQAEMLAALRAGRGNDERWHQRKDGSRFWASGEMMPLKDAAGTVQGFIKVLRDRTSQREAAEKTRADAEFLRSILASSGDCIKVLDLDAKLTFMSEGGQRVMEVSDFNAIKGCPWPDFWQGRGNLDAQAALTTARAGGTGQFRGFAETMAGSPRWWDVQVTPIFGADGKPERLLSVSRDITATHAAEAALRSSETLWHNLFERIREGIILGELVRDDTGQVVDWRYLDVNPAWGSQVGVPPEAAIGQTVRTLFPGIEDAWVSEMADVVETGEPSQFLRQVGAIGRWYEGRVVPVSDDRFAVLFFEVTERKAAEDRRTAMIELDNVLRDTSDPDEMAYGAAEILGRTLAASRAGYGTTSDGGRMLLVDRDWTAPGVASAVGRHDMRRFGSYFEALGRGEATIVDDTDTDTRTTASTLNNFGVKALVNLPLMEHQQLVAIFFANCAEPRHWTGAEVSFMRNVAERTRSAIERHRAEHALAALAASLEKQVEERTGELMAAEEALRQSQKMEAVGQLTGGLAHDFNNLLTGVTGSLELLQTRIAQGRIKDVDRYINSAQGAAKRAAALTHRLLAFSRRQTLDPKPTDMNRLIWGMEDMVQRTVGPEIVVETVAAGGLWSTLVDPGQLENALLNLCINARDAMPDGGKITIETANRWLDERTARNRDLAPGHYVSLCVSDTGTGMTSEVMAKAFDPFFTTKPIGTGTGLGLSMIYGFVRQSGGQARIYSEVGQGTRVSLYLPRHFGPADNPEAAAVSADPPRARVGETVLVVDDEPTVRMLVTEILEDLGYLAIEAADGPAGMRVLQSDTRIDLLITDVGLPGGMNGRQVADAARRVRPELKVLFITGYAENAVLSHGHLDPGMHVLTKPFSLEALANRIKNLVTE